MSWIGIEKVTWLHLQNIIQLADPILLSLHSTWWMNDYAFFQIFIHKSRVNVSLMNENKFLEKNQPENQIEFTFATEHIWTTSLSIHQCNESFFVSRYLFILIPCEVLIRTKSSEPLGTNHIVRVFFPLYYLYGLFLEAFQLYIHNITWRDLIASL